jgi:uncharacterized membrane protein
MPPSLTAVSNANAALRISWA